MIADPFLRSSRVRLIKRNPCQTTARHSQGVLLCLMRCHVQLC